MRAFYPFKIVNISAGKRLAQIGWKKKNPVEQKELYIYNKGSLQQTLPPLEFCCHVFDDRRRMKKGCRGT
jgi:hypothetical protein